MWKVLLVTTAAIAVHGLESPLGRFFPAPAPHRLNSDTNHGKPLFLTPYINAGKLEEARQLSKVKGLDTDVESYSGFLTVNATHNSNMFFWFFPAKNAAKSAPVVLWLQGGPGGSSLFGLFVENGPFSVNSKMKLVSRDYSWHNTHSMLYIDNPVGTGFSFTDDGYATNEDDVARDLYSALIQFFTLFDNYKKNDFYITGESYAGKYVPAISYKIHVENSRTNGLQIPLKGLAIGDGLCDPVNQLDYSDFLYNVGLITAAIRDQMMVNQNRTKAYIEQGDYESAFHSFGAFMETYSDATGLNFVYNFLLQDTPEDFGYYPSYVDSEATRRAIHVGNLVYNSGTEVYMHLIDDFMRSVKDKIVTLLNNDYNVMIYNGQMDVIIDYIGTENLVRRLPWKGQKEFNKSGRHVWRVDDEVAGYVRHTDGLTQVMVRNAGHILPYDQPKWAYDMISRFTGDKRF